MNRDQKVTRAFRSDTNRHKTRSTKRKQSFNPKTTETDESSFSASRKKLKLTDEVNVPVDNSVDNRIINFILVFQTLSQFVKCKTCNSDVKFAPIETRGLGFKIALSCEECVQKKINSCNFINHSYEVNRRFILTMRLLGLGAAGCAKFCGLMDMPQFLSQSTYEMIVKHIGESIKAVFDNFMSYAVRQEIKKTAGPNKHHLTVSGDGTWKKRGFSSLYGVSSLIAYHTGKVIDIVIKSAYCKWCEMWEKESVTAEYEEKKKEHQDKCSANHEGSSGKMEVDAMVEMFRRSTELHNVKYANYIGDGDSKTYAAIRDNSPYEDLEVQKKECIGHVEKRMGTRLRNVKKNNKGLGGQGKLTGKMIDKLTIYYGLAIRRNPDSSQKMYNNIWATYFHYASTDKHPQHEKCPVGSDSWCEWQKALAALPETSSGKKKQNNIPAFVHSYKPLPDDVLTAIKPIYKDLSKEELLQRCLGGFTQNNNESYNQLIWKISPKNLPGGLLPVQIAAYAAACTFNQGNVAILKMFEALGVPCGHHAHTYVAKADEQRISIAGQRTQNATKEGRIARRQSQKDHLEHAADAEGTLYGPGIDDTV